MRPTAPLCETACGLKADSVAATSYSDLASVCEPSGKVRAYRGSIRAVTGSVGEIRTVNILPLEQFVRSVTAMEVSPSWGNAGGGAGLQAIAAQAIASRTFAMAYKWYTYADVCDRMCEAYYGAASRASLAAGFSAVEHPITDAVVEDTAQRIARLRATPEAQDGLSAFLDKRQPSWLA